MKVLHVTPSYFPATKWGGPIRSTKAICDGIHATPGMKVRVLTTDAASPERHDRIIPAALPYPVHFARRLAGHSIAPGLLARLPAAIAWADVVHLTATYSFPTLPTLAIARLLGRPVIWSPRGALQAAAEWDDAPNARVKHIFEKAAQRLRPVDTILHVTSPAEAEGSVARLPGISTAVIPNCVDIPPLPSKPSGDGLRLIYLGRLHPKKGLDLLMDAIADLPATTTLDIYGTGTPRYDAMLRNRAARFAGRVRLHGHVEGAAKSGAFAKADLFVLPSHSENFGIAVAEALAHSVPVITTTGTPWQALDHQGCGRCVDLAKADLATEIIGLAQGDLPAMGARGRAWMKRDFAPHTMNRAFADLYESVAAPAGERVTA